MQGTIQATLAWCLVITAALAFVWDLYDLTAQAGNRAVSEYIRGTYLRYPSAIAIGLLVAAHFCRWPWK